MRRLGSIYIVYQKSVVLDFLRSVYFAPYQAKSATRDLKRMYTLVCSELNLVCHINLKGLSYIGVSLWVYSSVSV